MAEYIVPNISKPFPNVEWNLRLLESEGIIDRMNPIRLTVRSSVSANIGYVTEGMDAAAVMKEFNGFLGSKITPGGSDVEMIQPAKFSDFNFAQTGGPGAISIMMRILPRVTPKDGKDIVQLDISALVLAKTEEAGDPRKAIVNPLLPEPIVKKRSVVTDAIVSDGGAIVLGGWTGEIHTPYATRVPVLGKLPIVGDKLFTKHMEQRERTTMLIMVRCYIER